MKDLGKTSIFCLALLLVACLNFVDSNMAVVDSSLDLQQEVLQGPAEEPDSLDLDNPGSIASVIETLDDTATSTTPAALATPLVSTQHAALRPIRAPPIA